MSKEGCPADLVNVSNKGQPPWSRGQTGLLTELVEEHQDDKAKENLQAKHCDLEKKLCQIDAGNSILNT